MQKRCQIKPLHHDLVIAEFQLVQGEQFLYHTVHLTCLIHNDLAVKIPALLIVIDTLCQSLCIALNECDRRLKLM